VRRIKVGSSSAEDDGAGAQTSLGLAGRVERFDDGGYQGDRTADAAGVAAQNGARRIDGRGARGERESRENDCDDDDDDNDDDTGNSGDGKRINDVAGLRCCQDIGSHPGQH